MFDADEPMTVDSCRHEYACCAALRMGMASLMNLKVCDSEISK